MGPLEYVLVLVPRICISISKSKIRGKKKNWGCPPKSFYPKFFLRFFASCAQNKAQAALLPMVRTRTSNSDFLPIFGPNYSWCFLYFYIFPLICKELSPKAFRKRNSGPRDQFPLFSGSNEAIFANFKLFQNFPLFQFFSFFQVFGFSIGICKGLNR